MTLIPSRASSCSLAPMLHASLVVLQVPVDVVVGTYNTVKAAISCVKTRCIIKTQWLNTHRTCKVVHDARSTTAMRRAKWLARCNCIQAPLTRQTVSKVLQLPRSGNSLNGSSSSRVQAVHAFAVSRLPLVYLSLLLWGQLRGLFFRRA